MLTDDHGGCRHGLKGWHSILSLVDNCSPSMDRCMFTLIPDGIGAFGMRGHGVVNLLFSQQ